ncbi:DUF6153 family protein [Streptomyces sp. NPDC059637]
MVTVRRTPRPLRPRPGTAGSLRLLWWGTLLLGLLYAHSLSGESVATHVAAGAAAAATASAHADTTTHDADTAHPDGRHRTGPPRHHDGEAGHAAQNCLSDKPQQSADLPVPRPTPLQFVAPPPDRARPVRPPADAPADLAPPRDSTILQV